MSEVKTNAGMIENDHIEWCHTCDATGRVGPGDICGVCLPRSAENQGFAIAKDYGGGCG